MSAAAATNGHAIRAFPPDRPPPFRPLPLIGHPHLQTLVAHFLPRRRFRYPDTRHPVRFPNGDVAIVHESQPATRRPEAPTVILIHGMAGSHRSGYLARFATRLLDLGIRVFRVDLPGCGESLPLCRQPSHGGRTDDLRQIYLHLAALNPNDQFAVVGFSLGGNALLRLLAEVDRPLPRLVQAVAVNPPIDMQRCCTLLEHRRNRLYERYFIYDLWQQARKRERAFPELKTPPFKELQRLRQFDDRYTAPVSGFRDAREYYAQASSLPHIERIKTPTLLLTARDDPFIDPAPFEGLPKKPNLIIDIASGGGHLGYLGHRNNGSIYWADERVLHYLLHGR